jgi:hypothetical protein
LVISNIIIQDDNNSTVGFLQGNICIKSKVEFAGGNDNHRGQSYFKVFPRTLSMMLEPVWNHLMEEASNNNDVDDAETEPNFDLHLKEFIAVHSTSSDCHEWLQAL